MIGNVLTIAGSDSSGGAGIQADIKTITMHGNYAMSVITALTAQNTIGVKGVFDVPADFVGLQLDAVFNDILPDSIKIGMVLNSEIVNVIAEKLEYYHADRIVIDPIMISTSGHNLVSDDAISCLCENLLSKATLITPNIPEAEKISGIKITSIDDMKKAALSLSKKFNVSVLVKGGHLNNKATDVLYEKNGSLTVFEAERIDSLNTHGTGCTLSSAIACNIARGDSISESVKKAKAYLGAAIKAGMNIGKGNGPVNHFYAISDD